jgi:hypothetical protein
MRIVSWLRHTVADFFGADTSALQAAASDSEHRLRELKAVAALAIARAHRSEVALRDALEADGADASGLAVLIATVEDDRRRAAEHITRYREQQRRVAEALERLGEMQRLAELNEERRALREFVAEAGAAIDEDAIDKLADEITGEAARLDVLEVLEQGNLPPPDEVPYAASREDLEGRARALLAEDLYHGLISEGADR